MTPVDSDIDALAALVELTITPGQRPGVQRFLALAHEMATVVADVPLDETTIDLAPVYRLPGPESA
ncbi:MAG: DUF4089 domain-containing protein [Amaricoccus sp.]